MTDLKSDRMLVRGRGSLGTDRSTGVVPDDKEPGDLADQCCVTPQVLRILTLQGDCIQHIRRKVPGSRYSVGVASLRRHQKPAKYAACRPRQMLSNATKRIPVAVEILQPHHS